MRFHTYTKFSPEMADAVDLQSLLDKLADFLLQSGFAGGKNQQPYYGLDFGEDGDRSLEALKQAILDALIERTSGGRPARRWFARRRACRR